MSKIHSVAEAFGTKPFTAYVGGTVGGLKVAKIVLRDKHFIGNPFPFYIGLTEDDDVVFELRAEQTNVTYRKESEASND